MLQFPREGRVIDEVKVRLGTIHYISRGGDGVVFFWGGVIWFSKGEEEDQSSPTG